MTDPRRIQLHRTKGWRKPDGAIVVTRRTKWGNPYRISYDPAHGHRVHRDGVEYGRYRTKAEANTCAVELFADYMAELIRVNAVTDDDLAELEGRDLCCFCPPSFACHADVLLDLANKATR